MWALGATLYAAVEGRLPVEDRGNPIATLTAIATAAPPRPEHAGPLTPVLARMLEPDASARCTMAEAAVALGAIADQHPTQTLETPDPTTVPVAVAGAPTVTPDAAAVAAPVVAPVAVDPDPTAPEAVAPVAVAAPARDAEPDLEERRRPWLLVAVAVVLLLAAGGVALGVAATQDDDPAVDRADGAAGSASPTTSTRASRSPSAPAAEPPTEPETSSSASAPEPTGSGAAVSVTADGPEQLVSDYYALLPDDTRSAWSMLGDGARADAGGYDGYAGFWDTIGSVAVEGTSLGEDGVVTVDLVYDGAEQESRRLLVEEVDGGWLITDDLGPA